MVPQLRHVLFGSAPRQRSVPLALAAVLFGVTFAAYALDVFQVAGGVVFLPGHAAVVGALGAAWVGYRRSGLALAWLVAYAALLGYNADHSFLGLSGRSFAERAGAFLRLDGLVFLGVEALVLGTLGFLGGMVCARGTSFITDDATHPEAE